MDRIGINSRQRLIAIDLFSGAGGLTLGLKQAGFEVLAGIEIDPVAAETYRKNHSDVVCIEKDIRLIDPTSIMLQFGISEGELSLLAGCPPCQGFSTLRTRKKSLSVGDDRNDLLFEYLRFVEVLKPKALMMENVPALAKDGRMGVLLSRLTQLGYTVNDQSVSVKDAAMYGIPQRRKRMIMQVMKRGDIPDVAISAKVTVRDAFHKAKLMPVGLSGDTLHDKTPCHSERVVSIIKAIPKNGGGRVSLPPHLILNCHKNGNGGFRDVYGRMSWDDVSPTITGGCGNPSKGRFIHPEEDRAISLREAAVLQTFPTDYWFSEKRGRTGVSLMIGNALPPEFIRKHAVAIASALTKEIS